MKINGSDTNNLITLATGGPLIEDFAYPNIYCYDKVTIDNARTFEACKDNIVQR